jgi:hypothetical protein
MKKDKDKDSEIDKRTPMNKFEDEDDIVDEIEITENERIRK